MSSYNLCLDYLHSPNITSSRPSNTSSQGARFDFLYGPEDWGFLPYWAHVVPIFIAQFHTLLCIIFLCNGLPFVLGFCQETWSGICGNRGDVTFFFGGVDAHPERGKLGPVFTENPQKWIRSTWLEMTCFTWFFSFFLEWMVRSNKYILYPNVLTLTLVIYLSLSPFRSIFSCFHPRVFRRFPPGNEKTYPTKREVGKIIVPHSSAGWYGICDRSLLRGLLPTQLLCGDYIFLSHFQDASF